MKIVSWNVNGLRAILKNRHTPLKTFLDYFDADILCLQETKASRSQIGIDNAIADGYTAYFSFCKLKQGYSGVVTFCRSNATPIHAEEGISGINNPTNDRVGLPAHTPDITCEESAALDCEGRGIITEHLVVGGANLVVINVYCPRVDPESPADRLPYKVNFITTLRERCRTLIESGRQVVLCGDFNCTREVIDSATLQEMPTFPRENASRDLLSSFICADPTHSGEGPAPILLDSFRFLHQTRTDAFTCWCNMTDSRKLNYGQRIDYIFVSLSLKDEVRDSQVLQNEMGSDHCPVSTTLSIELSPSGITPSLCSSNYPEFAGKQSKMLAYFTKTSPSAKYKRKSSNETSSRIKKKLKLSDNDDKSQPSVLKLWKKQDDTQPDHSPSDPLITINNSSDHVTRPNKGLSDDWKTVFKAPPKPPKCKGHNEPTVLRTVKKNGPNKHRKFYVCARPDGAKGDPEGRCDHFQWVK